MLLNEIAKVETIGTNKQGFGIIQDHPAVEYVAAPNHLRFRHGTVFAMPWPTTRHGIQYHRYTLGSVCGYAVEYGDDPIAAYERAKANGHKLQYVYANAVSIGGPKRDKDSIWALSWGDIIAFEGKHFRLDKAPNQNVTLTEMLQLGTPEGDFTYEVKGKVA